MSGGGEERGKGGAGVGVGRNNRWQANGEGTQDDIRYVELRVSEGMGGLRVEGGGSWGAGRGGGGGVG